MKKFVVWIVALLILTTSQPLHADSWIQATYIVHGNTINSASLCAESPSNIWNELLAHQMIAANTDAQWYRVSELLLYKAVEIDSNLSRRGEFVYWQPSAIGEEAWIMGFEYITGTCHQAPPLIIEMEYHEVHMPIFLDW